MTAAPVATHDATTHLPVSEIFGRTVQGEGPHAGRICGFLRLGYCNLTCSWCDTPFTWDHSRFDIKESCPPMSVAQIRDALTALKVNRVILSGGEPLLWAGSAALRELLGQGFPSWRWDAETNGTKPPPDWWRYTVDLTCVSPKLAHSGVAEDRRIVPESLIKWAALAQYRRDTVAFKFVTRAVSDLDEVDALVRRFGIPRDDVWIMPEGTTPDAVMSGQKTLAQATIDRGYNLSSRLHTLLWSDERGR